VVSVGMWLRCCRLSTRIDSLVLVCPFPAFAPMPCSRLDLVGVWLSAVVLVSLLRMPVRELPYLAIVLPALDRMWTNRDMQMAPEYRVL
jgi:hypothetical protein